MNVREKKYLYRLITNDIEDSHAGRISEIKEDISYVEVIELLKSFKTEDREEIKDNIKSYLNKYDLNIYRFEAYLQ